MKKFKKTVVLVAIFTAITGSAFAAQDSHQSGNDAFGVSSANITLEQAVATAQASVPGEASRVKFSDDDGKAVWEVEIIDNNDHVYDLEIDANNGTVIKKEVDRSDDGDHEDDEQSNDREDER